MTTQTTKQTILIVEDEIALLNVLRDKFGLEDFATLEAKNGEEGLAVALREHPDLILLDIVMPKLDGLALLKKLREDSWGKMAKVIILTNLSDLGKVSEAVAEGSYEYLVKSDWKLEAVVEKVKEKLKR